MSAGRTVSMAKRAKKRKPLDSLSPFSTQNNANPVASSSTASIKQRRPSRPRSRYGCALCNIHLCRSVRCWAEHLHCASAGQLVYLILGSFNAFISIAQLILMIYNELMLTLWIEKDRGIKRVPWTWMGYSVIL